MVYGNLVVLAILILTRFLCAIANAGATIIFSVSLKSVGDCTAPMTSFVLVVMSNVLTVVVCYGCSV